MSGSNNLVANDVFCRRIAKLCDVMVVVVAMGYRLALENRYPLKGAFFFFLFFFCFMLLLLFVLCFIDFASGASADDIKHIRGLPIVVEHSSQYSCSCMKASQFCKITMKQSLNWKLFLVERGYFGWEDYLEAE